MPYQVLLGVQKHFCGSLCGAGETPALCFAHCTSKPLWMHSAMADNGLRTICYVVQGHSNIFKVEAPKDDERISTRINPVLAKSLTLWKVCIL